MDHQEGVTRKCAHCGRVLPLDRFNRNKYQKYGRVHVCKDCMRVYTMKRYDAKCQKHDISSFPGEEWKDVVGFCGLYRVSNFGRVMSIFREDFSTKRMVRPRILKPKVNKLGYVRVTIRKDGKTYTCKVHTLVAEAFLEKPNDATEINHKNGNPSDNRVENLEWCTRQYNIWHSYYVNGRKPSGCKPVLCIDNGITYPSCMAAGRALGIDNGSIARVAKGEYKQMKGYHFKFVE